MASKIKRRSAKRAPKSVTPVEPQPQAESAEAELRALSIASRVGYALLGAETDGDWRRVRGATGSASALVETGGEGKGAGRNLVAFTYGRAGTGKTDECAQAHADFIARAPRDMEWLLAERRRLVKENASLKHDMALLKGKWNGEADTPATVAAKVEGARAAVNLLAMHARIAGKAPGRPVEARNGRG